MMLRQMTCAKFGIHSMNAGVFKMTLGLVEVGDCILNGEEQNGMPNDMHGQ
jgi:hypothetical protein